MNADDTDAFRAEHWAIRNRRSPEPSHRDIQRLKQALQQVHSGSDRERYRLTLKTLQRQVQAA